MRIAIVLCLSLIFGGFSQKPAQQPSPTAKATDDAKAPAPQAIFVTDDKQRAAVTELELRRANLELQLRLLLQVPNTYLWRPEVMAFVPPPQPSPSSAPSPEKK